MKRHKLQSDCSHNYETEMIKNIDTVYLGVLVRFFQFYFL